VTFPQCTRLVPNPDYRRIGEQVNPRMQQECFWPGKRASLEVHHQDRSWRWTLCVSDALIESLRRVALHTSSPMD
jgi:hypothetical protein